MSATSYDAKRNLSSAGTFSIVDDMKPRVINLEFPNLPIGSGRAAKLAENGLYKDLFLTEITIYDVHRRFSVLVP